MIQNLSLWVCDPTLTIPHIQILNISKWCCTVGCICSRTQGPSTEVKNRIVIQDLYEWFLKIWVKCVRNNNKPSPRHHQFISGINFMNHSQSWLVYGTVFPSYETGAMTSENPLGCRLDLPSHHLEGLTIAIWWSNLWPNDTHWIGLGKIFTGNHGWLTIQITGAFRWKWSPEPIHP